MVGSYTDRFLKSVGRQLRHWTREIRQPGGTRTIGGEDVDENGDDQNLSVGPTHQLLANVVKIQKGIQKGVKRVATSDITHTTNTN